MAETEKDTLQRISEYRQEGENGQRDWRERGRTGADFYRGKQWDEAVVQTLKAANKPSLTINHILPLVNWFTGVQRQSRKDFKVLKRKGGNQAIARVLTGLAKHTMDLAIGQHEVSGAFEQGVKTGKGWVHLPISKRADPFNGELGVRQVDCFDIWEDPAAKEYNLNDSGKFLIRRRWIDKGLLELSYPEKKKDLVHGKDAGASESSAFAHFISWLVGDDEDEVQSDFTGENDDPERSFGRKYRYCVQETWWKEYEPRVHIRDVRTETRLVLDAGKKQDDALIQQYILESIAQPQAIVIKYKVPTAILHVSLSVGNILLQHVVDPFNGYSDYPFVRFSPYWDDGKPFGLVDNLKSPQQEENKRRSQVLHLLNQTSNSGWIVGTLSKGYKAILEKFGSVAGVVIEKQKCGDYVQKIAPNELSRGHMEMGAAAADDMKSISGVNHANMGVEGRDAGESGRLNALKQRQGLTVSEVVFDNLDQTTHILGTTMVELIRHSDVYDKQEIGQVIDEEDLIDPEHFDRARRVLASKFPPPPMPDMMQMRGLMPDDQQMVFMQYRQAIDQYTAEMDPWAKQLAKLKLFTQLKSWATGRYGVVVSESVNAPTTRIERQIELSEVAKLYPGAIPPQTFIKATSLDEAVKQEIIESLDRQAQAAQLAGGQAQVA